MPLRGDWNALDDLIAKLEDDPLPELAEALAEEALELVAEGFEESRAPDGTSWAELAVRDGKPLEDTGTLRNGWHVVEADANGFKIGASVWYADVHQNGCRVPKTGETLLKIPGVGMRFTSVQIPARPMVPSPNELPAAWEAALTEAAHDFLDDWFRSR